MRRIPLLAGLSLVALVVLPSQPARRKARRSADKSPPPKKA